MLLDTISSLFSNDLALDLSIKLFLHDYPFLDKQLTHSIYLDLTARELNHPTLPTLFSLNGNQILQAQSKNSLFSASI